MPNGSHAMRFAEDICQAFVKSSEIFECNRRARAPLERRGHWFNANLCRWVESAYPIQLSLRYLEYT